MEREEPIRIEELKSIEFEDLIRYAILQALRSAIEDITKFSIAVENLESLMVDELPDEYFEKVNKKWQELDEMYGKKDETLKIREFTIFKFRELIKLIKRKSPIEVEELEL